MIALIGGSGTVGTLLAAELAGRNVPFRVVSRDPAAARARLGDGVTIVPGDLGLPTTLPAALAGAERVFLATPVHPDQCALQANAVRAARAAGVRHIVKLSNLGADPASDFPIARWHGETERLIEASGLEWTHLRPHAFMQNLLHQAQSVRETGELAGPFGRGRISMVDARDIAAAARAALLGDAGSRQVYELTGPEALSHDEIAAALAKALGVPVRFVDISPREARARMIAGGRPDWYTDALLVLFAKWKAGGWGRISDGVQRLTGRPPYSLAQFLAHSADALRGV